MLLSDVLKGGQTLQGKAGPLAINANDLLLTNSNGQLCTVAVSDYAAVANAGAAIVAATTVSSYAAVMSCRKEVFVNPADSSIIVAADTSAGLILCKYSGTGALLGSVSFSTASPGNVAIVQLSNGNLAIFWGTAAGSLSFAIIDTNLDIIVGSTVIVPGTALINAYFDVIALSGGGFAVSYSQSGGVYLAIYTNTGAVTSAGTLIASSPTTTPASRLTQLSSGNIAVAVASTASSDSLGYSIFSAAGASVVGYTILDTTANSEGIMYPAIATVSGYFCVGGVDGDGTRAVAYVMSNAGVLQGSPYAYAIGGSASTFYKMVTDGTNFEFVVSGYIAFIPVTGSGYVTTSAYTAQPMDAVYDRGFIVVTINSTVYAFQILSNGGAQPVASFSLSGFSASTIMTAKAVGDFAVLILGLSSSGTLFAIEKYLNASIVGVSQQAVAAGNAGTLVSYAHGGGTGRNGYPCNPILGTVGKGFNHSGSNIVGNTGTMLGNSVALEGII